jgi:hypothetical protein
MELRRPLGDQHPADTFRPAAGHQPVAGVQHLASVDVGRFALRHEVVRLVDHQVQRVADRREQRAGEVDEPTRVLADGEAARIQNDVGALLGDQAGDGGSATLGQGNVGVLAAEEHDVEAAGLAVGSEAQTPPGRCWVHHADLPAVRAGAARRCPWRRNSCRSRFCRDGNVLVQGGEWNDGLGHRLPPA